MIPSEEITGILSGNTAGNPVGATPPGGGAVSAALHVLPASGPVGAVASAVLSILSPLIKQSTGHLSYDAVLPSANQFQSNLIPVLVAAYGPWDSWAPRVAQKVTPLFADAMQNNWGLGTGLNQQLYSTVTAPDARLIDQLGFFVIWVGTNVDQASADSFSLYFNTLFAYIFLTAFQQAGLDATQVAVPQVRVAPDLKPGGRVAPATGPGVGTPSPLSAGMGGVIAILAIGGAFLFMKGK